MDNLRGKLEYQGTEDDNLWTPIACPDHSPTEEHTPDICAGCDPESPETEHSYKKIAAVAGVEGHQPDCPACVVTLNNTLDHRDMVLMNRKAAERRKNG